MERFLLGGAEPLGERQVGVIAATEQLARDGHILMPSGIDLSAYRSNPVVLWQHDPESPVGVSTAVGIERGALAARIEFAPAGISTTADEICALVKSGVVRGISVGFQPLDMEPIDPRNPRGGQYITRSELLEISFCSVPVDTGATVVARSFASIPGAMAMLRALPSVTGAAIERVQARFSETRHHKPYYLWSPQEKFEADRKRTMTVWAMQQASREEEKAYSYEQRQADLRRLSGSTLH